MPKEEIITPQQKERNKIFDDLKLPELNKKIYDNLRKNKETRDKKNSISEEDYGSMIKDFFSKIKNKETLNDESRLVESFKEYFDAKKTEKEIISNNKTTDIDNIKKDAEKLALKTDVKNSFQATLKAFNSLTSTKTKVNALYNDKNSEERKNADAFWNANKDQFTDITKEIPDFEAQFKKSWIANERLKKYGQPDKYKDQKEYLSNYQKFENSLQAFGITLTSAEAPQTNEQVIFKSSAKVEPEKEKKEETTSLKVFKDRPEIVLSDSKVNDFLPKSETENTYKKDIFDKQEGNEILRLEKKNIKNEIVKNLEKRKLSKDYIKFFDEIGNVNIDGQKDKESDKLKETSQETQQYFKEKIANKCSNTLNNKLQENMITKSIGAITRMFDIKVGSGNSQKSLMDQFKTDKRNF